MPQSFLRLAEYQLEVLVKCLDVTYKVARKCPVAAAAGGFVLDTVFGPRDEFDYVSTTSPASSPPIS